MRNRWLIEVKVRREKGGERWMSSTKPVSYSEAKRKVTSFEALGYKARMKELLPDGDEAIAAA